MRSGLPNTVLEIHITVKIITKKMLADHHHDDCRMQTETGIGQALDNHQ